MQFGKLVARPFEDMQVFRRRLRAVGDQGYGRKTELCRAERLAEIPARGSARTEPVEQS